MLTAIKVLPNIHPKNFIFLLLLSLSISCETNRESGLSAQEYQAWKKDKKGCQAVRSQIIARIDSLQRQWSGISETRLIDFLGAPDKIELYEKNQKFLIYYIAYGKQCKGAKATRDGKAVRFRFNSSRLFSGFSYDL